MQDIWLLAKVFCLTLKNENTFNDDDDDKAHWTIMQWNEDKIDKYEV
jgi:hypothetical protein